MKFSFIHFMKLLIYGIIFSGILFFIFLIAIPLFSEPSPYTAKQKMEYTIMTMQLSAFENGYLKAQTDSIENKGNLCDQRVKEYKQELEKIYK